MVKQKSTSASGIEAKRAKYDDLKELSANQKPLPDIYTKPPQQPTEKKVGQLTEEQLKQFFEKVNLP